MTQDFVGVNVLARKSDYGAHYDISVCLFDSSVHIIRHAGAPNAICRRAHQRLSSVALWRPVYGMAKCVPCYFYDIALSFNVVRD